MYIDILNKIEEKYYKACYAAYNYDFDNFVANFEPENLPSYYYVGYEFDENEDPDPSTLESLTNQHELTYYIVRGVRFSFYFAWQLRHSDLPLCAEVYRAISARFIMSNYLEDDFIKDHIPACLWYPNIPKKETCFRLLEISNDYKYSLGALAGLNNWGDLFSKCDFEYIDGYIWTILRSFERHEMLDILLPKKQMGEFLEKSDGSVTLNPELEDFDGNEYIHEKASTISDYLEQFEPEIMVRFRTINKENLKWVDWQEECDGPAFRSDITGIGFVKHVNLERLTHLNNRMEELYM
ncbi:uncharacterized protein NDAI_0I01540 [Naumovozyma dairenensis CBS 421]|uniref:Uncharacterized protein n=1 Tax=Naumovozyma dairenensis (strain ATCC 10597 / BCRC 20456 / CBS 421 / NBRC 0211 / NRRL Y-12639) TaxID=1071378 RepID=G0WG12_NAUDC|nr:hypothetical protein NDAI_0I01540 [Naumovozyma dairenensis CBS 421]CCD26723.1 hypothetical protein NDAI_0I01540 [Naumovozyma dairenensis CBS 421]